MTTRRILVLAVIVVCGAVGDVLLSRGMKNIGAISLLNWPQLISAVLNPWVASGILLLLVFLIAYSNALSWADLTYVVPATSFSYVLIALLSQFLLQENVTLTRWLGILLVSGGVGIVAPGPFRTRRKRAPASTVDAIPEGQR